MSHTTHACQPPLDDDTRTFAYAGIGSRQTPSAVLDAMARIAQALGNAGVALSTDGADGADQAFETGALRTRAPLTVHTPWPGYNGYRPGSDARPSVNVIRPHPADTLNGSTYADLARRRHPAWDRLRSRGCAGAVRAQRLHPRRGARRRRGRASSAHGHHLHAERPLPGHAPGTQRRSPRGRARHRARDDPRRTPRAAQIALKRRIPPRAALRPYPCPPTAARPGRPDSSPRPYTMPVRPSRPSARPGDPSAATTPRRPPPYCSCAAGRP